VEISSGHPVYLVSDLFICGSGNLAVQPAYELVEFEGLLLSKAVSQVPRLRRTATCPQRTFVILGSGHWPINLPARKKDQRAHHAHDDLGE
jgi:hypothetical protein